MSPVRTIFDKSLQTTWIRMHYIYLRKADMIKEF